jgi:hypothetical protein
MKKIIAKYMLYIYLNFVKDYDVDIYNNWALPIVNFVNFVRGIYIWSGSVILFPLFMVGMIFDKIRINYLK